MTKSSRKAAARATSKNKWLATNAGIGFLRRIDNQSGRDPRVFLLRDRPRFTQTLARSIRSCFYCGRIQSVRCDGQTTAHRVDKNEKGRSACVRVSVFK